MSYALTRRQHRAFIDAPGTTRLNEKLTSRGKRKSPHPVWQSDSDEIE